MFQNLDKQHSVTYSAYTNRIRTESFRLGKTTLSRLKKACRQSCSIKAPSDRDYRQHGRPLITASNLFLKNRNILFTRHNDSRNLALDTLLLTTKYYSTTTYRSRLQNTSFLYQKLLITWKTHLLTFQAYNPHLLLEKQIICLGDLNQQMSVENLV